MHIEQIYTNCLAQASYYIESEGEAAVIDPIRDYEVYLQKAAERGAKIKFIFETHFHADFVSGHLDMAKATGATIVYGPGAQCGFDCISASDNDVFTIGNTTLKVLHTPGHTPESACYLLHDENGTAKAVFTGDTLFVGDVGRPDLCQAGLNLSMEDMASMLYDSLNTKIATLDDDVIVYPGHGAGSACGKSLGPENSSTIGKEKATNYAMQPMTREAFISTVTDGITAPPSYFFEDAALNRNGYSLIDDILKEAQPLDIASFEKEIAAGALVLDTRVPDMFETGFIPNAMNIGLNGQYAIWAASLIELDRKIVIVAEPETERESIMRLARVGFSNIKGYLHKGMDNWLAHNKPVDMVISIGAEEFALDKAYSEVGILDVRKPAEWATGIVENATLINLEDLQGKLEELDREKEYDVHCAGGYRSMIACSIMKANGFKRVKNVYGGFAKIKTTGISIVVPADELA